MIIKILNNSSFNNNFLLLFLKLFLLFDNDFLIYILLGCFTCCMESGLRVYNVEPLVEKAHLENDIMGSIAIAEMLWRTNIIAIVGGGTRPKFAENTVLIYDDLSKKFIMEVTFTSPIKAIRLRRDK